MARAVAAGKPLWDMLPEVAQMPDLPVATVKAVGEFCALVDRYRELASRGRLVLVLQQLLAEIGYQDELARQYKDPNEQAARWNAVEEVVNALAGYVERTKRPTLAGFIEDVALVGRDDSDDKESRLARNAVVLMTLHSAKGLEYPHVYLVGMEEGLLPHHRAVDQEGAAIDEERRLCYVGVTRAQDRLTLTLAQSRMKWGKKRPTIPSRFLFELLGKADRAPTAAGAVPNPKSRPAAQRGASQKRGTGSAERGGKTPARASARDVRRAHARARSICAYPALVGQGLTPRAVQYLSKSRPARPAATSKWESEVAHLAAAD